MSRLVSSNLSLESPFWQKSSYLKQLIFIITGVFLLAFASQLSIPLKPVPLTFQSATVILIGMVYGSRQGAAIVFTYWIVGICGLPVFADHVAGIQKFYGLTGGYLIGFLPAAYVSGFLAECNFSKNSIRSFIAACISASIIYICGLTLLTYFVGFNKAIIVGLKPFIFSEIIKLILLALIVPKLGKSAK